MTTQVFEIPLSPQAQTFNLSLSGITYRFTIKWNVPAAAWILDIADANDAPLIQGIPLITGADLLAQYEYVGIGEPGAQLQVQTDHNQFAVPTYSNLGLAGKLYYITP